MKGLFPFQPGYTGFLFFLAGLCAIFLFTSGLALGPGLLLSQERQKLQFRSLPVFSLEDQFGNPLRSQDLKGKSVVLLGCYPEDETLCRKLGRKIYWYLESLLLQNKVSVERIGYIQLKGQPSERIQNLLPLLQKPGYEPIFLDRKGELESGLKKGIAYLRTYNRKGELVREEYRKDITKKEVEELFHSLAFTIQREK